jgi:transcription elongation factor Elf1
MSKSCNKVVYLDDYRQHMVGNAVCGQCGHEWVAVIPAVSEGVKMECSECGKMEGQFK